MRVSLDFISPVLKCIQSFRILFRTVAHRQDICESPSRRQHRSLLGMNIYKKNSWNQIGLLKKPQRVNKVRIPDCAIGVDPEGGGLHMKGRGSQGLGLVYEHIRDPELVDRLAVDVDEVVVADGDAGDSDVAPDHSERGLERDILRFFVDLKNVSQVYGDVHLDKKEHSI